MKTRYPSGIELMESGRCPAGAHSPVACMICPCGHMLECHYPHDCTAAQCQHLAQYDGVDDPLDFGLDPDFSEEDFSEPTCEYCGCTEGRACPGGCAWSERYLCENRLVCTQCETFLRILRINMDALAIWQENKFLKEGPHAVSAH